MARKLKVFGWQGNRSACPPAPNGSRQTREVCAAYSQLDVARLAGKDRARELFNLGETDNAQEIDVALSRPRTVLWRPLDSRDGKWIANGDIVFTDSLRKRATDWLLSANVRADDLMVDSLTELLNEVLRACR